MSVKIKICGVTIPEQAQEIARLGADYIGCVIEFPKSPRSVSAERAREIREAVESACHSGAKRSEAIESSVGVRPARGSYRSLTRLAPSRMTTKMVGVVVDLPFDHLSELVEETGIRIWQLHGSEDADYVRRLKESGVEVWKVTHHKDFIILPHPEPGSLGFFANASQHSLEIPRQARNDVWVVADKIVVDAKNLIHGAGGSGKLSDWDLARQLVEEGYDVVLSGGLNPENVQEGITYSRSRVVDTSSGIETAPGIKDLEKVGRFIKNVKSTSSLT